MKSIKSFALAAIAILGVACGKPAPTPTPVPTDVTFYPAALTLTAEGTIAPETVSFKADAAAEWTIVVPNTEWLTVTGDLSGKGNGSFNVAVAVNEEAEERETAVRVVVGEKENIFAIKQAGVVKPVVKDTIILAAWAHETVAVTADEMAHWESPAGPAYNDTTAYKTVGFYDCYLDAQEGKGTMKLYNASDKSILVSKFTIKASTVLRGKATKGLPISAYEWLDDYWYVETTDIAKATKDVEVLYYIKFLGSATACREWVIEVKHGKDWKTVTPKDQEEPTIVLAKANAKQEYLVSEVLEANATEPLAFRLRCVGTTKVNGDETEVPVGGCTQIAAASISIVK